MQEFSSCAWKIIPYLQLNYFALMKCKYYMYIHIILHATMHYHILVNSKEQVQLLVFDHLKKQKQSKLIPDLYV